MKELTPAQKLYCAILGETTEAMNVPVVSTEQAENAISSLASREQEVIRLRFGFKGKPLTLDQVGVVLPRADGGIGLSRERVRQIEAKALRKLRHPKCIKTWRLVSEQN